MQTQKIAHMQYALKQITRVLLESVTILTYCSMHISLIRMSFKGDLYFYIDLQRHSQQLHCNLTLSQVLLDI